MALSILIRGCGRFPGFGKISLSQANNQLNNRLQPFIFSRNFTCLNRTINNKITSSTIVPTRNISHSTIWAAERVVSLALLGVVPACIAFPNAITDNILAATVVIHMHWGIEAVVVDYVRPLLFGNVIPAIARSLVFLLSAVTLGGLMYFNFNDVGCGKAIRKIWAIKN